MQRIKSINIIVLIRMVKKESKVNNNINII